MRLFLFCLGLLAGVAAPALAQPSADTPTSRSAPAQPAPPPSVPAPTPAPPTCDGLVDVHVVDAQTHEALPGALVRRGAEITGTTDETGHFLFTGECAGALALEIELMGYQLATQTATVAIGKTVTLEIELTELQEEVIVVEDRAVTTELGATAVLSGAALERKRGRALAETLSEVPGVTQLRSGSGMAKPIVRGQYGRRLLILIDGVRHRAQEWGLDHAPEVDPFVAERLTVVRGAAGVRYGSDAIGGAVLVDPPELLKAPGSRRAELHAIGAYNGTGGTVAGRVQAAPASVRGLAWQLQGSFKRLAAPSTPDYALDNTGALEASVGGTVGYRKARSEFTLSYLRYQAELGVCSCLRLESSQDFYDQLERARPIGSENYRADFEIERPSQAVVHDLALARGKWEVGSLGTAISTLSFQHDHRQEYEIVRDSVTGPQFNFRLFTAELESTFVHYPIHLNNRLHLRGSAGIAAMGQLHDYSGLPLVPDHRSLGGGVHALERLIGHDFELELGLRYDVLARDASIERRDFLRLVRSGQLAEDACGEGADDPVECGSVFHTVSASLGALRQLTPAWAIKGELSTASRPPNPDEQYLNGSAPTFPVVGLGQPTLGPETTYSASVTSTYQGARVAAEVSAYANLIDDYIYFAPAIGEDGLPIFDVLIRGTYPRFVTKAVDAVFYGFDGGLTVQPAPWLELGGQVSLVRAKNRTDDGPLVFVPPDQVRGSVTYRPPLCAVENSFVSLSGSYVARQKDYDLAADFAPPPAGVFLLGAEAGFETTLGSYRLKAALQGTNLLNTRYREYTSLMRYFADQPGTQVLLRLSLHTN